MGRSGGGEVVRAGAEVQTYHHSGAFHFHFHFLFVSPDANASPNGNSSPSLQMMSVCCHEDAEEWCGIGE